jgi:hypothetical protein
MATQIPEAKQQMIHNILSNAQLATDDEIVFYLQSKTKLDKSLLEQIVSNERPRFSEGSHVIDFGKYSL